MLFSIASSSVSSFAADLTADFAVDFAVGPLPGVSPASKGTRPPRNPDPPTELDSDGSGGRVPEINRLLARCRWRDSDAETTLFRRYERFVMSVAAVRLSRAMRQRIDAADIVQEVFDRLFRYIAWRDVSFATEQEFLGFLCQFTKNRILKRAQAESAAKRDLKRETACDESPDCVAPESFGAECQELLEVVRRAVAKQFGDARFLEAIMGRSNKQIAVEFGISTKTVGRRMRRIWKAISAYDPSLMPSAMKRRAERKPR